MKFPDQVGNFGDTEKRIVNYAGIKYFITGCKCHCFIKYNYPYPNRLPMVHALPKHTTGKYVRGMEIQKKQKQKA